MRDSKVYGGFICSVCLRYWPSVRLRSPLIQIVADLTPRAYRRVTSEHLAETEFRREDNYPQYATG